MEVVSSAGLGTENFWQAALAANVTTTQVSKFDATRFGVHVAGQVSDAEVDERLPRRLLIQTDRATRYSLVASESALAAASLDPQSDYAEFDGAVVTANSFGGVEFLQNEQHKLYNNGPKYVSAYMSYAWFYGVNTGQISIRHKIKGQSGSLVTGQAGGLDALGQARRRLRSDSRFVLVGGADAPVCEFGIASLAAGGDLSSVSTPLGSYLPFDENPTGHVVGEGAGVLVLERLEDANRRSATALGALSGYSSTFDPAPATGRPSTLATAAVNAIADAGLSPTDIDVVFADGAGTSRGDRAESAAIVEIFGAYGVPVTVPKAVIGRMDGAGAIVDTCAAVRSLQSGVVPPTVELAPDLSHHLDLVTGSPRRVSTEHALVLARGYGGFNSAVVISRLT